MKIIDWLKDFFTRHQVQAKVEVQTPWPFPVVTGTPPVEKKKPAVKKKKPIDKDTAIKSMKKKPATINTAARAASKKKKASK